MNDFEKLIYNHVRKTGAVSSVELANEFGKGDYWLTSGNNVVVGFGLSDDLSLALFNLTNRADLVHLPCSYLVYLLDGRSMTIPIAERIPKNGFKEPHWQPSLFYTYDQAVNYLSEKLKDNPQYKNKCLKLLRDRMEANK